MRSHAPEILWCAVAALLWGCAAAPPPQRGPATPAPAPVVPRDVGDRRSHRGGAGRRASFPENRARDAWRHPLDTLLLFGIRPDMTVAEVWPGSGGWYTEVLAPLLAANGRLYVAPAAAQPGQPLRDGESCGLPGEACGASGSLRQGHGDDAGCGWRDIAPPASCDLVVTFRNLHSWMNLGYAPQALAAIHRALKPGGILGVVDHRADPARPQDPRATNGYVNEQYAIDADRVGGFRAAGDVRDQRQSAGHEGLRAGSLVAAAGAAAGKSGSGEVSGDRRERPVHAEVQEALITTSA